MAFQANSLFSIFEEMAGKYFHTKFLRILSTEAKADYDDIALPTVIIYKAGKVEKCWVRFHEEIKGAFEYEDVEAVLRRHQFIQY